MKKKFFKKVDVFFKVLNKIPWEKISILLEILKTLNII